MMAPGLPQIGQHFHETSQTIVAMSLSVLLLAWVFSPLIFASLSEMYGREHASRQALTVVHAHEPQGRWLYHFSNLSTLAFSLACAFAPTMGSFIGFRFLCEASSSFSQSTTYWRNDSWRIWRWSPCSWRWVSSGPVCRKR